MNEHSPEWYEPFDDNHNPNAVYDEGNEEPHDFQEEYEAHLDRLEAEADHQKLIAEKKKRDAQTFIGELNENSD